MKDLITTIDNREAVTSSRVVATAFGKRHDKLVAEIRRMYGDYISEGYVQNGGHPIWFYEHTYIHPQNKQRYTEYLMNRDGFAILVMGFTGTKALEWKMKFLNQFNAMEAVIRQHSLEGKLQESIDAIADLRKQLRESGILKEYIAPHHFFDHLTARWKEATHRERIRDFYDEIGSYAGVDVPYSNMINITVKEWLLNHVGLSTIEELVIGLETHTITYSIRGKPVSKHGVFGNRTEWTKVVNEFGGRCAYCGAEETPLIAEHIIPQSVLSINHPEAVDMIGNIVPACQSCNR
ncbi:Rha family transcriptional regulator [Anaerovibrio sp.]|uniref:Rha family transcriptional regulator n=1 Tax=Anaerovibrio sp. TaxID=1872532 RepID=UPI003F13B03D